MNNISEVSQGTDLFDVLIVCALKDEYDQLLRTQTGIVSQGWIEKIHESGRTFADATFLGVIGVRVKFI